MCKLEGSSACRTEQADRATESDDDDDDEVGGAWYEEEEEERALAELRLFHCHIPPTQRIQTEAAIARRYGLPYSCAPEPPPTPRGKASGFSRFSCAPRSPLRSSNSSV